MPVEGGVSKHRSFPYLIDNVYHWNRPYMYTYQVFFSKLRAAVQKMVTVGDTQFQGFFFFNKIFSVVYLCCRVIAVINFSRFHLFSRSHLFTVINKKKRWNASLFFSVIGGFQNFSGDRLKIFFSKYQWCSTFHWNSPKTCMELPLTSSGSASIPVAVPVTIKPSLPNNSAASAVSARLTSDVTACALKEKTLLHLFA